MDDNIRQLEEITVTLLYPDPLVMEPSILLRELNHRISNGLASAVNFVSAAAVRAEGSEAKSALSDVAELLHGYGALHRALAQPENEALIDAGKYIRRLGCAIRRASLDRMNIRLALASESIPIEPERCWRLGLIVNELITNVIRQACFDGRAGAISVNVMRIGAVVNCVILDNGSRSTRRGSAHHLRISKDLAKDLRGRVDNGVDTGFASIVLTFPLTQREWQANRAIAKRRMRSPRRLKVTASDSNVFHSRAGALDKCGHLLAAGPDANLPPICRGAVASPRQRPDVVGQRTSLSHSMDTP